MNNNNSKGVSYTSGFFILIGLALLGLVIASFIGVFALGVSTGGKISSDSLNDPKNADILRIIQALSVIVGMFAPAVITASILNRKPFALLGFQKTVRMKQVLLVLAIVILSLFIATAFSYINKLIPVSPWWKDWSDRLEKQYADQVTVMLNLKSFGGYISSLLIMAFLPALCEETLFRGGLQNFLTRATRLPWLSILIVSIIFSLVHFSFYGFLPRLFLGVILGTIYYFTNNIWLSLCAHFLNNALAVTQVYMLTLQGKNMNDAMNQDVPGLYWGFVLIPAVIFLLKKLKDNSRKEPVETDSLPENFLHGI
ncbi:MAG: type II CAAX prenyl endopeptidase Rce1 family protein [Flavisolibacter sp.]|jgi:membrane protease YdiL (CAAX protease family)